MRWGDALDEDEEGSPRSVLPEPVVTGPDAKGVKTYQDFRYQPFCRLSANCLAPTGMDFLPPVTFACHTGETKEEKLSKSSQKFGLQGFKRGFTRFVRGFHLIA